MRHTGSSHDYGLHWLVGPDAETLSAQDVARRLGRPFPFLDSGPEDAGDVHAIMLRAERSMRDELFRSIIADISGALRHKARAFARIVNSWRANRRRLRDHTLKTER